MASFGAADYQIFVHDSSYNLVGQVDKFDALTYIKRFNQVGSFTLQLSITHPMAAFLQTPGYGIIVNRNGVVDFSGPVRYTERQGEAANTVIVKGYDDLLWLTGRMAYPYLFYPYPSTVNADSPLVAYPMGDTGAGGTVLDVSGNNQTGGYHGTVTCLQPPIIDDIADCVLLGANGYVSAPTGTLPTGNQPYTIEVWWNYTGTPASTVVLGWLGTPASTNSAYMGYNSSGVPICQARGVNFTGTGALSVGVHCMQMVYTGLPSNSIGLYVDNIQQVTGTTGAVCTLAYGSASFGCLGPGTSNFAATKIAYGAIYGTALSITRLNAHVNIGFSIFAVSTYDYLLDNAESMIKHYVEDNAGPNAFTARQVPNLTVETSSGRGTASLAYSARFEQLLQADGNGLIQLLARISVPELGFKVVPLGSGIQFQMYVPTDKTASVIFSAELGNLANYVYVNDFQSIVNYVLAGGGGNGTGRAFVHQQNDASIALYGRFETFVAHQSAANSAVLTLDALNALAQAKSKPTFNGVLLNTAAIQYGRDYNLGDKVSVVVDGVAVVQDLIREVQVALSANAGEVITPAIGTPNSGQILNGYTQIVNATRAALTRVAQLDRTT